MLKKTLIFISLVAAATIATAQPFPQKTVQVTVPYSPGGLTDNLGRLYANKLAQKWKQSVIVVNKPGAGASIGAAAVTKDPADGHSLLVGSVGMTTNALLINNLTYDPKAFAPLTLLALAPNVLYVHPSLPVKNVRELVMYGKANPGKLTFATTGVGSSPHLAAELFAAKTGIKLVTVPYKGTGPAMADVLGGQVMAYFDTMQSMQFAKTGRLRALAVTTDERIEAAPDLPTVIESGVAPGVISSSWFGFFIRADVPADIQQKISADVAELSKDKEFVAKVAAAGLIPQYKDQAAFKDFVNKETAKWTEVIRSNGLAVN